MGLFGPLLLLGVVFLLMRLFIRGGLGGGCCGGGRGGHVAPHRRDAPALGERPPAGRPPA